MMECVVFDFDGTLVLSNDIKRRGFLMVASEFSGGPECMEMILARVSGDRTTVLSRFAREMGITTPPAELVDRYTAWCEDRIVHCPERTGASRLIARLREHGIAAHVISATPDDTLHAIIARRYPATFDGIHGGHGRKAENLQTVVAAEDVPADSVIVIGDGLDDQEAARAVGCAFVGVGGGTLEMSMSTVPLVDDLEQAWPAIAADRQVMRS